MAGSQEYTGRPDGRQLAKKRIEIAQKRVDAARGRVLAAEARRDAAIGRMEKKRNATLSAVEATKNLSKLVK